MRQSCAESKNHGVPPLTNGLAERLNKTIVDMLSMYVDVDAGQNSTSYNREISQTSGKLHR